MTDHFECRETHEVFNYIFARICCMTF